MKKCPPKLEMIGLRANPASIASLSTGEDVVQTFKESVKAEDNCNFTTYVHHQASGIRFPVIYDRLPAHSFWTRRR